MGWYEVRSGDTLLSIAQENEMTVGELLVLGTSRYEGGVRQLTNRDLLIRYRDRQGIVEPRDYLHQYDGSRLQDSEQQELSRRVPLYSGEVVWVPDTEETPARGASADAAETSVGDTDRRARHRTSGTDVRGASRSGDVVQVELSRPPWGPNDLSRWFSWQNRLSARSLDRTGMNEEFFWCACASGRRITLFWRQIRNMRWTLGVRARRTFTVGPFLMRCCNDDDVAPDAAVAGFRQNNGGVPDDFADEAVRFHAWRVFLRDRVDERAAVADSFAIEPGGARHWDQRQHQHVSSTLDPTQPYYAPVTRVRCLLRNSVLDSRTWGNSPVENQVETVHILASILLRGTRWRLRPGEVPPEGWFGALVRDVQRGQNHRDVPPMNVREFYRVLVYSTRGLIRGELDTAYRNRVDRMLEVMDHCRERYNMQYLRPSSEVQ